MIKISGNVKQKLINLGLDPNPEHAQNGFTERLAELLGCNFSYDYTNESIIAESEIRQEFYIFGDVLEVVN